MHRIRRRVTSDSREGESPWIPPQPGSWPESRRADARDRICREVFTKPELGVRGGVVVIIPSSRDPRLTASINPRLTASINPRLTASLNPRLTASLNPRLTASLSPRLTASINPRLSSSLNYRLTAGRNPALTASINPRLTASLNPNLTGNIRGLYLHDDSLNRAGFTVEQSDHFWLVFDPNVTFMGVAVRVRPDFFNIFDLDNDHTGFFVHATGRVWLRFDEGGEWVGSTS